MRLMFLLTFFCPFLACAQVSATIDISFENSKIIKIERRTFFKFHSRSNNFELIELDNNHYRVDYLDSVPGVIYINYKPIIVSPGDNVKLTSKRTNGIDSLFATGRNAQNYTYSNFVDTRLIKGDIFPDLRDEKYQINSMALYTDLIKAYAFRDDYYSSHLKKEGYSNGFSRYIHRLNTIEFLSNALSLATELGENYRQQYPAFGKEVDDAFLATDFVPADTTYTYRMEETFYAYFWHLSHVRFHPIESQKNFEALLDFVIKYPNPFIREYFIFFLTTDFDDLSKKYALNQIEGLKRSIQNINIINELNKQN